MKVILLFLTILTTSLSFASAEITSNLSLGSKGDQVKELQRFLKIEESGYFGSKTKAALISYQKLNGISSTGNTGPSTRNTINKKIIALNNDKSVIQTANVQSPVYETVVTTSGSQVVDLNNYYRFGENGFYSYINKITNQAIKTKTLEDKENSTLAAQNSQSSVTSQNSVYPKVETAQQSPQSQVANTEYLETKSKLDKCIADISKIKLESQLKKLDKNRLGGLTQSSAINIDSEIDRQAAKDALLLATSDQCISVLSYIPQSFLTQPKTTSCTIKYAGFGGNYTVICQ